MCENHTNVHFGIRYFMVEGQWSLGIFPLPFFAIPRDRPKFFTTVFGIEAVDVKVFMVLPNLRRFAKSNIYQRWSDPPENLSDHAPVNYVAHLERQLLTR